MTVSSDDPNVRFEIVTEPVIRTPDEAWAYLNALRMLMVYGDISDCDMEKGQMRCDANVSIRPVGQEALGVKVEIKNMNSISGVTMPWRA